MNLEKCLEGEGLHETCNINIKLSYNETTTTFGVIWQVKLENSRASEWTIESFPISPALIVSELSLTPSVDLLLWLRTHPPFLRSFFRHSFIPVHVRIRASNESESEFLIRRLNCSWIHCRRVKGNIQRERLEIRRNAVQSGRRKHKVQKSIESSTGKIQTNSKFVLIKFFRGTGLQIVMYTNLRNQKNIR